MWSLIPVNIRQFLIRHGWIEIRDYIFSWVIFVFSGVAILLLDCARNYALEQKLFSSSSSFVLVAVVLCCLLSHKFPVRCLGSWRVHCFVDGPGHEHEVTDISKDTVFNNPHVVKVEFVWKLNKLGRVGVRILHAPGRSSSSRGCSRGYTRGCAGGGAPETQSLLISWERQDTVST